MNKVPEYLAKIVNGMAAGSEKMEIYTVLWLNEWLDTKKLEEKYGTDWKQISEIYANYNKAVGYMEAVGRMYLRKLKKLPEITGTEMEVLSQEVSKNVCAVIQNTIHQFLHQDGQEDCCNTQ